jgi:hypothetical protein
LFTAAAEATSSSDDDSAVLNIYKERNELYLLDNALHGEQEIISMVPHKKRKRAVRLLIKPKLAKAAAIQARIHDAAVL